MTPDDGSASFPSASQPGQTFSARPRGFARLARWLRGDGLFEARIAACRAAGVDEPERALHALDLSALARSVYERREPAPAARSAQLGCRLALAALEIAAGPDRDLATADLIAQAPSVWSLPDAEADRLTRETLVQVDRRLAPAKKPLARLARARVVARFRGVVVIAAVALMIACAAFAVFMVTRPKNLITGKPFRTSSTNKDYDPANHTWHGIRLPVFFLTNEEPRPWIEFDLQAPRTVRRVVVQNRTEYRDRAVPLVLEVSNDQKSWREIARQTIEFFSWQPRFPAETTRYVRLRVDKTAMLHFEAVGVFAE